MIDIIIPTYNNKEGLIRTLNSIPAREDLTITVVDDCSTIVYPNIYEQFPHVHFSRLFVNCGPGLVRQWGIEHTNEPYIMFADTGDYFISPNVFDIIIAEINKCPNVDMFSWQHISEFINKVCNNNHNRLHARVYKREFIEKNDICFCPESSFVNEDVGFNRICRLFTTMKFIPTPIYIWTSDENSLTRRDNGAFTYQKQNMGLALNGIHIYNHIKGKVSPQIILKEIGEIMGALYYNIVKTAQERPEYLNDSWEGARLFYTTIYKLYGNDAENISLHQVFSKLVQQAREKRDTWTKPIPLNVNRFLSDIDKYENPPSWYK